MASKLARILATLIVIFTMSITPAFGQETIPADTEANAPAEKMSLAIGDVYAGTWMTPGSPVLPSKLTIKSIDNEQARVRYEWGDEDNGGHVTVPATILPDGSLTWGGANNSPKFTFRLNDDGSLNGLREVQAGKSEVTMTKVSDAG